VVIFQDDPDSLKNAVDWRYSKETKAKIRKMSKIRRIYECSYCKNGKRQRLCPGIIDKTNGKRCLAPL